MGTLAVETKISVVIDSHIQRFVVVTEETTMTQRVSHRPIKCQSRLRSQICTKVNGSHHRDSPLLKQTEIQIATKPMPGPTNGEHRKIIGIKTMSLGTNYNFHYLECCQCFRVYITSYREDLLVCCPINKIFTTNTKHFLMCCPRFPPELPDIRATVELLRLAITQLETSEIPSVYCAQDFVPPPFLLKG